MKTYGEGKGRAPLFLNTGTVWRSLYPLGKNARYPLNKGYGVDLKAGVGAWRKVCPCWTMRSRYSDRAPIGQVILAPRCTQCRRHTGYSVVSGDEWTVSWTTEVKRQQSNKNPHRWGKVNRYSVWEGEGETVKQKVLGHGLGGGQDCDLNFLQNTTFHYLPSQWVQRTLPSWQRRSGRVTMTVSLCLMLTRKIRRSSSCVPPCWGATDRGHFHFSCEAVKLTYQSSRVTDCIKAVLKQASLTQLLLQQNARFYY
jgi:hypothetical protein